MSELAHVKNRVRVVVLSQVDEIQGGSKANYATRERHVIERMTYLVKRNLAENVKNKDQVSKAWPACPE